MIEKLKKFPKDKPVKLMGWYSIVETDVTEDINKVYYLKEVDFNTLEVKGKLNFRQLLRSWGFSIF